jgi:hypothetical protein
MQVCALDDGRSRIVWITDILPHERAAIVRQNVDQAAPIIQRTLAELATTAGSGAA